MVAPTTWSLLLVILCAATWANGFVIESTRPGRLVHTSSGPSTSLLTQPALPRAFYDDEGLEQNIVDHAGQAGDEGSWTSKTMDSIASWTIELDQALKTEATDPTKFVKLISTRQVNSNPSEWEVLLTIGGGHPGAQFKFYAVILGPEKYHRGVALDSDIDVSTLRVEIIGNGNLLMTSERSNKSFKPQGRKFPVRMSSRLSANGI